MKAVVIGERMPGVTRDDVMKVIHDKVQPALPDGVPVATVAVGSSRNAGLLAVRILAAGDPALQQKMTDFQAELRESAQAKGKTVRESTTGPRRTGF